MALRSTPEEVEVAVEVEVEVETEVETFAAEPSTGAGVVLRGASSEAETEDEGGRLGSSFVWVAGVEESCVDVSPLFASEREEPSKVAEARSELLSTLARRFSDSYK